MSIKPILFNAEMVRAILYGRKTVTRRLIKPQPKFRLCYAFAGCNHGTWSYPNDTAHEFLGEEYRLPDCITDDDKKMAWKPPYHGDDILYVRETFDYLEGWKIGDPGIEGKYFYRADGDLRPVSWRGNWHPSLHMQKEAARIWLKIKDVRVERLQCMSWDDICNEGLIPDSDIRDKFSFEMLQNKFKNLWDSTIKKSDIDRYGWDANPWVWVIEFERCKKPED